MDLSLTMRTQTTRWTRRQANLTPLAGSRRRSIDYESTIERRGNAFSSVPRVKVIPELVKRRTFSLPEDADWVLTPLKSIPSSNAYRLSRTVLFHSPLHPRYRLLHPKAHFPSTPRKQLRTVLKGHKAVLNVLARTKAKVVSEATCTDL